MQLQDNYKVPYSVVELDAAGNIAIPNEGDTCTVSSSDTEIANVIPDNPPVAGSLASGFVVAAGKLGTATITATTTKADGSSIGDSTADVEVVAGSPVKAGFNFGTPVPQ